MSRIKILFVVNNEVIVEESSDMELKAIEKLKFTIAEEIECGYHDIEVIKINPDKKLGDELDLSVNGLVYFNDLHKGIVKGVECCLNASDNRFLDAISNGNLEDFITFTTTN